MSSSNPIGITHTSGLVLVRAGKAHYDAGQFSQALQVLQQAAQTYAASGDKLRQAQSLSLVSLAAQALGQWQAAQAAINSSLSLLATLSSSREHKQVHAQVLNAQGHLQLALSKAEAALRTWQEAEALYKSAGDEVGVLGSQIDRAEAMRSLGLYRRAETIFAQIEQTLYQQADSTLKATGLLNFGNILRQERELDRSKTILELSLTIAQRLRSPRDESQALLSLANTERALATRAQELDNLPEAQTLTQQALTRYQNAAKIATSPITRVQAQLNQLSLAIEIGQFSSFLGLQQQISELLPQLPTSRASVYAHVNLAQSLMKLPSSQDIAQLVNRAIEQAKSLEDKRAESYALGTLGQFYEKAEDWSKSKMFTQQALLIAQQLNAPDMTYQWQWQMGRLLQAQIEKETNSKEANADAIAYYTEALKTLNQLRSDLVALNSDIQFSFRERVEPVYRQLVDLLVRSHQPSKNDLIQARAVIEALQLAELDNFFRDACARPQAVNIDNLDPTAAVIYPIILKDRLEVILKLPQPDNLRQYANNGVSETQVDEAVKRLRNSLVKRSTSLAQLKHESNELYNWLIAPFEAELESKIDREHSQIKTLVFVLDGSLRNIPMAALYDGKRYLVERYAIAVTSGLQLLDPKPLPRTNMNALLAGVTYAPSFEKEGFGALANVEVELKTIGEKVPHSQILENQEFLQENVQKKMSTARFNIIHLATHGKFSSNPEQTFLLDWNKRIKVQDLDSLLRTSDRTGATPVELLILSACQTATGDKRAALGLAGVAVRAGARSTIATLWSVNDASTAQFMIQFYEQLNNPKLTKAEAVRNAQQALLTQYPKRDYNRPYYWAPFILIGNWL
ncbi:MAG TPA: CHAT domain-containing protein [Allocoleopsis sp.]